jgi:hypothetical protein
MSFCSILIAFGTLALTAGGLGLLSGFDLGFPRAWWSNLVVGFLSRIKYPQLGQVSSCLGKTRVLQFGHITMFIIVGLYQFFDLVTLIVSINSYKVSDFW